MKQAPTNASACARVLEIRGLAAAAEQQWQNAQTQKSDHGRLRDELLNGELFDTLWEARVLLEHWRREYNAVRPHSALGYRPPAPEAWSWVASRVQIGALRMAPGLEKLYS